MKKSEVISFRITDDYKKILDEMCNEAGVSRNELLSNIVSNTLSKSYKNMSPLERVLFEIRLIVDEGYNHYTGVTTPCIILGTKEDDGEYAGKEQILVGDDTLIREKDGQYYSYEMSNPDAEPIWLNELEIVEYYQGLNDAYGTASLLNGDSYHYMKGYFKTLSSLVEIEKCNLEEYEIKHGINNK